jgi:hypothetical protein
MAGVFHELGPGYEKVTPSFTVTFSKVVENGVGMEKIGKMAKQGFLDEELQSALEKFDKKMEKSEKKCRVVDLNDALEDGDERAKNASVLIVPGACKHVFDVDPEKIRNELWNLGEKWDTKKYLRGRVVNSLARRNMCIADEAKDADIAQGKGTVLAWKDLPELRKIRDSLGKYLGCKAEELHAEGNFYHHKSAGIGFHGDAERKIVIAMRFGEPLRLHYQAYKNSAPVGKRVSIDDLVEGDLYVMGDKATGNDWRKKKIITWRHAAERFHNKKPKYCFALDDLLEKRRKAEEKKKVVKV